MFRCQVCRNVVSAGTPSHRLAVKQRTKEYPYRPQANLILRKPNPEKKRKKIYLDDPGGEGRETIREVLVCAACAATLTCA